MKLAKKKRLGFKSKGQKRVISLKNSFKKRKMENVVIIQDGLI